jgi:hypothetical protein
VRNHVTFWIIKTPEMSDPEGRLRGAGRTANLKLTQLSDFDEAVRALVARRFVRRGFDHWPGD